MNEKLLSREAMNLVAKAIGFFIIVVGGFFIAIPLMDAETPSRVTSAPIMGYFLTIIGTVFAAIGYASDDAELAEHKFVPIRWGLANLMGGKQPKEHDERAQFVYVRSEVNEGDVYHLVRVQRTGSLCWICARELDGKRGGNRFNDGQIFEVVWHLQDRNPIVTNV